MILRTRWVLCILSLRLPNKGLLAGRTLWMLSPPEIRSNRKDSRVQPIPILLWPCLTLPGISGNRQTHLFSL